MPRAGAAGGASASDTGGKFELSWEFKLPWREANPPNHLDDQVDSDQYVVNTHLSLPQASGTNARQRVSSVEGRACEALWPL